MPDISSLIARNRNGERTGLPCFCTANEQVLHAVMQYAAKNDLPVVVEATCNQVNQHGGYTGMKPADYARCVLGLAEQYGVPRDDVVLGGDHLGPNPWRAQPVEEAMAEAEIMVRDYVAAGFTKIHLDASMACGGEPTPSFAEVAERAARLCRIAEDAADDADKLFYIIGTEVPIPGGETDDMADLAVTSPARFHETIDTHREAFERHDLAHVWPRIVSVVTQPGVDFSHTAVHRYRPAEAADLVSGIAAADGLTFEAHSTDYQPTEALAELVDDHFFFLKVGPELTFRMREGVMALAAIEDALNLPEPSNIMAALDDAMTADPSDWSNYYQGTADEVERLRVYSFSDRIRYYWNKRAVQTSLNRLLTNLRDRDLPQTLISQHFQDREFEHLAASADTLLSDRINRCVARYYSACGY